MATGHSAAPSQSRLSVQPGARAVTARGVTAPSLCSLCPLTCHLHLFPIPAAKHAPGFPLWKHCLFSLRLATSCPHAARLNSNSGISCTANTFKGVCFRKMENQCRISKICPDLQARRSITFITAMLAPGNIWSKTGATTLQHQWYHVPAKDKWDALLDPISYKRKQSSALERAELRVPGTPEETYHDGISVLQYPILLHTPPMPTAGSGTAELFILQSGRLWTLKIVLEIFSSEMLKGCFSTSVHLTFCSQQGTVLGNAP